MKKAAIVYHCFVHYRMPVLQALSQELSGEYELTFLSDVTSPHSGVAPLDFEQLRGWRRLKNLWLGPWLWQRGLIRDIVKNKYDVLVLLGQFNFLSTWVVAILARLLGTRVLFWSHGVYGNESRLKLIVRESFYRLADGMLLYGNYARGLMIPHGFDPDKMYVIYNSLDYESQKRIRDSLHADGVAASALKVFRDVADYPYVVFIGRLTEVKKLDMLLSALIQLDQRGVRANLLFIGDGPMRDELEKMTTACGLGRRVEFYGECHDELVVSRLLYGASVCVAPGNVGLTAMHAMAYGTPVITHDDFKWQMPEFESIQHRVTGSFYRKGCVDSLTEEIEYWLTGPQSRRRGASAACVQTIEAYFNPTQQVRIIRNAFEGVPASKAGPLRSIS